MNAQEIINSVKTVDSQKIEESVRSALSSKISILLDDKRKEIGDTMFTSENEEYITEAENKIPASDLTKMYRAIQKQPGRFLDTKQWKTLDEFEKEVGGQGAVLDAIAKAVNDVKKINKYVRPELVVKDFLEGKIDLTPTDANDKKIQQRYKYVRPKIGRRP